MRNIIFLLILGLATPGAAWADLHYTIQVDGLACPFCAFGIEKRFRQIDGVKKVLTNLEKGRVYVLTDDDVQFTDEQLTRLFETAGFTYRGMDVHAAENHQENDDEPEHE